MAASFTTRGTRRTLERLASRLQTLEVVINKLFSVFENECQQKGRWLKKQRTFLNEKLQQIEEEIMNISNRSQAEAEFCREWRDKLGDWWARFAKSSSSSPFKEDNHGYSLRSRGNGNQRRSSSIGREFRSPNIDRNIRAKSVPRFVDPPPRASQRFARAQSVERFSENSLDVDERIGRSNSNDLPIFPRSILKKKGSPQQESVGEFKNGTVSSSTSSTAVPPMASTIPVIVTSNVASNLVVSTFPSRKRHISWSKPISDSPGPPKRARMTSPSEDFSNCSDCLKFEADLHDSLSGIPSIMTLTDASSVQRLLKALTHARDQLAGLAPYCMATWGRKVARTIFRTGLLKLPPELQSIYLSPHAARRNDLYDLISFIKHHYKLEHERQIEQCIRDRRSAGYFCSYCKWSVDHHVGQCPMLARAICFACLEMGHVRGQC